MERNEKLTVGFAVTVSGRWPRELGLRRLESYGSWICRNFPDCCVHVYPQIVASQQDTAACVEYLRTRGIDLMVQLYGAFTGDDVCCAFADGLKVPIVLWAPSEERWERQDRLYANALCSATMNGASLTRLHAPWHLIYGDLDLPRVKKELETLLDAYAAQKALQGVTFGLFGYRPTAFYNCAFDEVLIRRTFGVNVEETDLKVVFDAMEQLPEQAVEAEMKRVTDLWDASALPPGHLENHARLYLALKEVFCRQGYGYAAIKCWPEMGNLHTTPCAVLGRLIDEGITISCEGDMDAGLTAMVQNILTGKATFITDLIRVGEAENTVTFWHCGNAAPSLHDRSDGVTLCNHPLAGQGSAFWCALRPGQVTAARFANIDGRYRLFLLRGEAIPTKRCARGAMVDVTVKTPVLELIQRIAKEGMSHHWSVVWEDVADRMITLCKLLDIPVIEF